MNRNHHCINLQYYSSNIGVSLALSSSLARNNCTMVLSWSQFMRLQFFFLTLSLCGSQKNFPRWQNGRITKKRRVDTVVMRRNDQNSHLSTASANIRHSLRIWSSLFVWFSLSRRPLTTRARSSWSSSARPPGQSILITSSLEQVGWKLEGAGAGLFILGPVPLLLRTPLTTLTNSSWSSSVTLTLSRPSIFMKSSPGAEGLTVSPTPPKKVSSSASVRRPWPWGRLPLGAVRGCLLVA